jgi:O-phosphoseryl-tRNA synthetase
MYSPVALANYDIKYSVFNLGFGLERILMVKKTVGDVREILYPQFYAKLELSDQEIAGEISVDLTPETGDGRRISEAIVETAVKNADAKSPCGFTAFKGRVGGKKVEVKVVEREENTMLLGPAALNEVYVYDGSIYGLPEDTSRLKASMSEVQTKGVNTGLSFIQAVAGYAAARIEGDVESGEKHGVVQFKMAKTPADVNIAVGGRARRFILSNNKVISVKGPVFTTVEYGIK